VSALLLYIEIDVQLFQGVFVTGQNILDVSKTRLGKLLASENIRIEHRQVQGPFFDVKDRVLVLPIWKDMDADLYDLLIGHEVGHALFTPIDGWNDLCIERGLGYKQVLNIVEDARIEKKMKRLYPGLRRPMYNGYSQLLERNFFGMTAEQMKFMNLVDRINVFFKLGTRADVFFNVDETNIIDRIENVETWDEVVEIANILYETIKDEQKNNEEMIESLGDDDIDFEDAETVEEIFEKISEKNNIPQTEKNLNEFSEAMTENFMEKIASQPTDKDEPLSVTEQSLTESQKQLINQNAYPITYVNYPEIDHTHWVVPSNIFYKHMKFNNSHYEMRDVIFKKFIDVNKKYIANMVKEFELRRNAKQFARAKISKTGDLDVNKLSKYMFAEDIFLQTTVVPNGKNHGMLMLVDMSSSMDNIISDTIEQIICLSMFCRKVNIPFAVYSFNDNKYLDEMRELGAAFPEHMSISYVDPARNVMQEGNYVIANPYFKMHQMLYSGMKNSEYIDAVKNLLLLCDAQNNRGMYYQSSYNPYATIPLNAKLSGTPLNEAIIVLRSIADQFKKDTKVEILNTIILTDGEASSNVDIYKDSKIVHTYSGKQIIVEDRKSHKQVRSNGNFTQTLLAMYKNITGSRVIGYYLMYGSNYKGQIYNMAYRYNNDQVSYVDIMQQYNTEFSKHRFFSLKAFGYDTFYMLPSGEIGIKDVNLSDAIDTSKPSTKSSLLKAFKKVQNQKNFSRVFVNRFIQHVS
jgi:hypothetical protein